MAGSLEDWLLQPDESENEQGSAEDDSDLEVVEADTRDPQEAEEPSELGDRLMARAGGSYFKGRGSYFFSRGSVT